MLKPLPILVALLITLPWFIAIGVITDGAFYAEALGRDLGGKVASAQETHGGPPGYYLLTGLAMFWPGIIAVPLAVLMAWQERTDRTIRWLVAWVVPMWVLLEFVPTKLPHYTLPLYPALALLAGAAWVRLADKTAVRRIGHGLFTIVAALLCIGVSYAAYPEDGLIRPLLAGLILAVLAAIAIWALTTHRDRTGLALSALLLGLGFGLLSRSPLLDLSPRLVAEVPDGAMVVSPDYREPSFVFLTSTQTRLTLNAQPGDVLILAENHPAPSCAEESSRVPGINYAKVDRLVLRVMQTGSCEPEALQQWAAETSLP